MIFFPTLEDYNVIIDGQKIFNHQVKNNSRIYENIRKIATGKADDYVTGSPLNYNYFWKNYKMIAIDLSKLKALDADPEAIQQINFPLNLSAEENSYTFFFHYWRSKTNYFRFFTRNHGSTVHLFCVNIISVKITQCNTLNVKLCNSQLKILKSGTKNGTEVTLKSFIKCYW